jgi:hypothetical protein
MTNVFLREQFTESTQLRLRTPFAQNVPSSGNASWISMSRPEWLRRVRTRLSTLAELPAGWDGYNAPKISVETALFAAQVLQDIWPQRLGAPEIGAMSSGGLMIEAARNGYELTIEIQGPYSTSYLFSKPDGDDVEGTIAADIGPLRQFTGEMVAADPVVALVA